MNPNVLNKDLENELNSKAWEYRYIDRNLAMQFALEATENAKKNKNLIDLNFAQLTITQLNFWKQSEPQHIIDVNKSLLFFTEHNNFLGIARAHLICASMYDQFGQYEKALNHAQSALSNSELAHNNTHKADSYTTLGQIYSRIYDYNKAIECLALGLDIRKINNEQKAVASSLNLIARNYVLLKNYTKAKLFYTESLELREAIKDNDGLPWTFLGLASLFYEMEEWALSVIYYNKAETSNLAKDARFELLCLIGKSKICLQENKLIECVSLLNEALVISKSLGIISLKSEIHQLLAEAYERNEEFKLSIFHIKKYTILQQEILSNEKINELKNQQIAFSVESIEKEAEIYRLKNVELKNAYNTITFQNNELKEKTKEITDSINYAKRIQNSYLPEPKLFDSYFPNSFILFKPKDIVSGDFYWVEKLSNENTAIAIADSTGHGVPGAFMSLLIMSLLNEAVLSKQLTKTDDILNFVRKVLILGIKPDEKGVGGNDGMDCVLLSINKHTLQLEFTGANNSLLIIRNNELLEYKGDKMPVGRSVKENESFTRQTIQLQKGDVLYASTDGFPDQFGGEKGKKFMTKNLKTLLLANIHLSMNKQKQLLDKTFVSWAGNFDQIDDVTIIGIKL